MIEQKNDAAFRKSGKSRVPFVAAIALMAVGFVFIRSVSGNESREFQIQPRNNRPIKTAATYDLAQQVKKGSPSTVTNSAEVHDPHAGVPPSVILQPHMQIKHVSGIHHSPAPHQPPPIQTHSRPISQPNHQTVAQPAHQSVAQPAHTSVPQPIHQAVPTAAHTVPASATQAAPAKPVEKEKGNFIKLIDEFDKPVMPSAVVSHNGKFFFLGPKNLWMLDWKQTASSPAKQPFLKACHPPASIEKVPVQEFNNMISVPVRKSLVILSKAGDLFEYFTETGTWKQYRANLWLTGSPDPDYVDLAFNGKDVILLDPERNQIWNCAPGSRYLTPYFREVMPWAVRRGDYFVGDGISIAYDGITYILRKGGSVTKFSGNSRANVKQLKMPFRAPGHARSRPSRMVTAPGGPLFIVERENNRVLVVDKKTGQTSHFVFSKSSDLRGLVPIKDGFAVVNGDRLVSRTYATADAPAAEIHARRVDSRLDGIGIPVPGGQLPAHLGVFPGARRLYRYGIHAGVDFFNGGGNKVVMGTPARAADSGKIIRLDRNFKDMDAPTFNRVMSQCAREHNTSEHNEDLFRGCQVWLDHGNRLVTRYAHLDKINAGLKDNAFVNRGDVVGFIGVSGTGQNLPGKAKYPHLHFEIWLDGHYVGYGLTPGETLGVYEDIFGTGR